MGVTNAFFVALSVPLSVLCRFHVPADSQCDNWKQCDFELYCAICFVVSYWGL